MQELNEEARKEQEVKERPELLEALKRLDKCLSPTADEVASKWVRRKIHTLKKSSVRRAGADG